MILFSDGVEKNQSSLVPLYFCPWTSILKPNIWGRYQAQSAHPVGHFPVCGLVDSAIPQVTGGGGDQEGTLEGWESRDLASEWGHNVPLDKKPRLSVPSFFHFYKMGEVDYSGCLKITWEISQTWCRDPTGSQTAQSHRRRNLSTSKTAGSWNHWTRCSLECVLYSSESL